jgi:hypothetical protein
MALETETKDKTMTDFNDWYEKKYPELDPYLDDISDELRMAYEAGAASQAGTLRDEFAGQAISPLIAENGVTLDNVGRISYIVADAMLEARKTTGEGE